MHKSILKDIIRKAGVRRQVSAVSGKRWTILWERLSSRDLTPLTTNDSEAY